MTEPDIIRVKGIEYAMCPHFDITTDRCTDQTAKCENFGGRCFRPKPIKYIRFIMPDGTVYDQFQLPMDDIIEINGKAVANEEPR